MQSQQSNPIEASNCSEIQTREREFKALVQSSIVQFLVPAETHIDSSFHEALLYALQNPGKMVRPLLVLHSCLALGGDEQSALEAAIAIELMHTYSLIHDDLPAMDNDRFRRGRLTVHARYDDATALLVGDALLTASFEVLANSPFANSSIQDTCRLKMIHHLAKAGGQNGMILGQALDLYWTNREGADATILQRIHSHKTGELMGASCALGALAAGASTQHVDALENFGQKIGLSFQIGDDCLDNNEGIGKTAGKDLESNKLTYLKLMKPHEATALAQSLTNEALAVLDQFGERADSLRDFVRRLLQRRS